MIKTTIHGDKFGYETITLTFPNSDSYFTILQITHSQNLEKADFQVENAEEFYVFVRVLRKIMKKKHIRYCELFVSAYKPELQMVLYRLGFTPRGYIPCWNFNKKTRIFEDAVLFNWYQGKISEMKLWKEGNDFLAMIKLNPN